MKNSCRQLAIVSGLMGLFLFSIQAGARDLGSFRQLRSYEGAPPIIPHEVKNNIEVPACLVCHQFGGYSPTLKTDIPKSPHPELSACMQCHVPQNDKGTFRNKTNLFMRWANENKIPAKTLVSAPPVIPHEAQMRQNCVSCHGGQGSVAEIKTPHPERSNCLQCHVWQNRKEQLIIK